MLNTIDFMALNAKYKKFRPQITLKQSPKAFWKFAYVAIIESQIRPKREQFKWDHIKIITKTRREYVNLLKKKLKAVKLTQIEKDQEKVISKLFKISKKISINLHQLF
jgi:hypothetical protein